MYRVVSTRETEKFAARYTASLPCLSILGMDASSASLTVSSVSRAISRARILLCTRIGEQITFDRYCKAPRFWTKDFVTTPVLTDHSSRYTTCRLSGMPFPDCALFL